MTFCVSLSSDFDEIYPAAGQFYCVARVKEEKEDWEALDSKLEMQLFKTEQPGC